MVAVSASRAERTGSFCRQSGTDAQQAGGGLPFHGVDGAVAVGATATSGASAGVRQRGELAAVAAVHGGASGRWLDHQLARGAQSGVAGLWQPTCRRDKGGEKRSRTQSDGAFRFVGRTVGRATSASGTPARTAQRLT